MSYQVTRDAAGRPRLLLQDEPTSCRALEASPPAREPELNSGPWLILAFAAWSARDMAAIETALAVAKLFGGRLTLGLRPFDDPAELQTWCPRLADNGEHPVWVLLSEGMLRLERHGILATDELTRAIEGSGLARVDAP